MKRILLGFALLPHRMSAVNESESMVCILRDDRQFPSNQIQVKKEDIDKIEKTDGSRGYKTYNVKFKEGDSLTCEYYQSKYTAYFQISPQNALQYLKDADLIYNTVAKWHEQQTSSK